MQCHQQCLFDRELGHLKAIGSAALEQLYAIKGSSAVSAMGQPVATGSIAMKWFCHSPHLVLLFSTLLSLLWGLPCLSSCTLHAFYPLLLPLLRPLPLNPYWTIVFSTYCSVRLVYPSIVSCLYCLRLTIVFDFLLFVPFIVSLGLLPSTG